MTSSVSSPARNPDLIGFRSLAGGDLLPVADYLEGCPCGRALERPTSVTGVYKQYPSQLPLRGAKMSEMGEMAALCAVEGPRRGRNTAARLHPFRTGRAAPTQGRVDEPDRQLQGQGFAARPCSGR